MQETLLLLIRDVNNHVKELILDSYTLSEWNPLKSMMKQQRI